MTTRRIQLDGTDNDVLTVYHQDGHKLCQINLFGFENGGGDVDVILDREDRRFTGHFLAMCPEPVPMTIKTDDTDQTVTARRLDLYSDDVRVWAVDIQPAKVQA